MTSTWHHTTLTTDIHAPPRFEPKIPASERLLTHATGIDLHDTISCHIHLSPWHTTWRITLRQTVAYYTLMFWGLINLLSFQRRKKLFWYCYCKLCSVVWLRTSLFATIYMNLRHGMLFFILLRNDKILAKLSCLISVYNIRTFSQHIRIYSY